jgi:hypothetical protein
VFPDRTNFPSLLGNSFIWKASSTAIASASASDALERRPDGPIDTEATADQPLKKQTKNIKTLKLFEYLMLLEPRLMQKRIENGGRSKLSRTSGKNESKTEVQSWQFCQKKNVKAKDKPAQRCNHK